ncbi:synembryn-A [Frankliniella occidentalis]|uniref:Synembryn-A n=1 Tax=Frankliniella occidentalis TaxID=133901 RepID=A0A9C6TYG8_FRAOC|nr:synembryn-A [Frankliniella occidentalis]
MEATDIALLEGSKTSHGEVANILSKFQERNSNSFTFPELDQNNGRLRLWKCLMRFLSAPLPEYLTKDILVSLRILSRDKQDINDIVNVQYVDLLLKHAGIVSQEEAIKRINENENFEVILEALKCLSNIVFNSPKAQRMCGTNNTMEGILFRLRTYRDRTIPDELKYFDMKMLFLITALHSDSRSLLKDELHGMTYLMELVDYEMKQALGDSESHGAVGGVASSLKLSNQQGLLLCEVLKVLFNICCKDKGLHLDEEAEAHGQRLVCILRDLLLATTSSPEKQLDLQNHTVNMLTAVPAPCLSVLVTPHPEKDNVENLIEYEGSNMEAIVVLLHILQSKLDVAEAAETQIQTEALAPVLTVLVECARNHRILRKFLRLQILPPLKETHRRPEEGNSLRNRLCRFLTSPNAHIKNLVAELLFILCKENVGRMIKYTGYGNAAGLLANRGLLAGRREDDEGPNYSSESEDSDTEEYKKYRHEMNPVTGCWEPPRTNPMEGMSEEQKEYEAVQLANLMAKLSSEGLVQPCRIGEDGRPEPVDHILQLQDELPRQQVRPPQSAEDDS